jgi:hypothetical protein
VAFRFVIVPFALARMIEDRQTGFVIAPMLYVPS